MKKKEQEFQYGGQALIEGVMMRGRNYMSVAIRKSDGRIITKVDKIKSLNEKFPLFKLPCIRGILAFFETLVIGVQTLFYSANEYIEDIEREEEAQKAARGEKQPGKKAGAVKKKQAALGFLDILIMIVFTVAAFILMIVVLPDFFTNVVKKSMQSMAHNVAGRQDVWFNSKTMLNFLEGMFRLAILVGYILLVSFIKDIKRVWSYHGAEHKTIFTYEAKEELTIDNAKKKSTLHPRCGTSFLIFVVLVSYIVFSLLPRPENMFIRMLMKISLMPLIAGLSYEIIKAAGRHQSFFLFRWLSAPGLWMQRITTREPDEQQLEVALAALNEVLAAEAVMDSKVVPVPVKKVDSPCSIS